MDCPFLSNCRMSPCTSTSDVFAHTLLLSDKYCKDDWFPLCPRFRNQQFSGTPPVVFCDVACSPRLS